VGTIKYATAGKPDCYKGFVLGPDLESNPDPVAEVEPCDSPGRDRTMRWFR
jgi:hypothetical protein